MVWFLSIIELQWKLPGMTMVHINVSRKRLCAFFSYILSIHPYFYRAPYKAYKFAFASLYENNLVKEADS